MAATYCPRCGTPLAAGTSFCPRCGTAVLAPPSSFTLPPPPLPPQYAPTPYPAPPPGPPSHTGRNIAIVVVLLLVVVVVLFVPVSHPFSDSLYSSGLTEGIQFTSFPSNVPVSGTWSTADGLSVSISISDAFGSIIYSADAPSGSFSFTSGLSPYTITTTSLLAETTSISGSYSAPLL